MATNNMPLQADEGGPQGIETFETINPEEAGLTPEGSPLEDSRVFVDIPNPHVIQNGLRLRVKDRDKPFASLSYGVVSVDEVPSTIDWTVLIPEEDTYQGAHIRCHQLKERDNLKEISKDYDESGALAVVLINTEDNYYIHDVSNDGEISLPLLILKSGDQNDLLECLQEEEECGIHAMVEITSTDAVDLEARPTKYPQFQPAESMWERSSEFPEILRRFLYRDGAPVCVSEDQQLMKQLFVHFSKYEQKSREDAVNLEIVKFLSAHQDQMIPMDFPFYILIADRLNKCRRHYNSKDLRGFLDKTTDKVENLDQSRIAQTLESFLQRGEFKIKIHSSEEKVSVFKQSEKACLRLMDVSLHHKSEAQPSGDHAQFYRNYIYFRMVWVSIAMKFHTGYDRLPPDDWTKHFLKDWEAIELDTLAISKLAYGLKLGTVLKLQFYWSLRPALMIPILVPNKPATFSQLREFVRAISPHIHLEPSTASKVMLDFLKSLYECYNDWVTSKQRDKLEALHRLGGEAEVINDGLQFLGSVLEIWRSKEWNHFPQEMNDVCKKWINLLLKVVNFKAHTAVESLKKFTRSKLISKEIAERFQKDIDLLVIAATKQHLLDLSPEQCFLLFKNIYIWEEENVKEFLIFSVQPKMRVSHFPWPQFIEEVVNRRRGASFHGFLVEIFEGIAQCYVNGEHPELFVLDLLQLHVPKLFHESSGGRSHTSLQYHLPAEKVCLQFTTVLCDYIYDNGLREKLLQNMKAIMDSISDQPDTVDHFQELVLSVVQDVVVPDIHDAVGLTEGHELTALQQVVVCLSENLQSHSPRQRFCWTIVNSCHSNIPVTQVIERIEEYSQPLEELCRVYESYNMHHSGHSHSEQDVITNINPHIKAYFEWVYAIQQLLQEWRERFDQSSVTYSEIVYYKARCKALQSLAHKVGVPHAAVDEAVVCKKLDDFLHAYDSLNQHMLKYIPRQLGCPNQLQSLTSLLADYAVRLPHQILTSLSNSVVLPDQTLEETPIEVLQQRIQLPSTAKYQPGLDVVVTLAKNLTLRELVALIHQIEDFLEPIIGNLDMLVFFTLSRSTMFQAYLKYAMAKTTKPVHSPPSYTSFSLPSISMVDSNSVDVSRQQVLALQKALQHVENVLLQLVSGNATYDDVTAGGGMDLNDESLDLTGEFKLFANFLPQLQLKYPELKITEDAGLNRVKDMLELFQFEQHIKNMQSVFEKYKLQGCLHDPDFATLVHIMNDISDVSVKAKLTPTQAMEKLHQTKTILCLETDKQSDCLSLFPAIAESEAFCHFLEEKQFTGMKGKEKFSKEYRLITTNLQHEEHDAIVLDHLGGAYRFMLPFTETEQSLQNLMQQILKFNATSAIRQLATVSSNLTLIQIWFLRAEGETLDNIAHQLNGIIESGYYQFNLSISTASERKLELVYIESDSNGTPEGHLVHNQIPEDRPQQACTPLGRLKRWKREQIDDFVRKLGFLDSDIAQRDKIQSFLLQNEVANKLLELFHTLRELGHPNYSTPPADMQYEVPSPTGSVKSNISIGCLTDSPSVKFLQCFPSADGPLPSLKVKEVEQELSNWRNKLAEWHSEYDWLLFLSVRKVLKLYCLLTRGIPAVWQTTAEINFLFQNDISARIALQNAVEETLPSATKTVSSGAGAMHTVGHFLKLLQERVEQLFLLPNPHCFSKHLFGPLVLHYGPNYTILQLTQMIAGVYEGVPQPFEVLHCHHDTTEEELQLFLERTAKHPRQYLIIQPNKLPFKLQDQLLLLSTTSQQRSTIHFFESSPSILQEMPWIHSKDKVTDFRQAQTYCQDAVKKADVFSQVKLVYGDLGDGKTHYIKKQLQNSPQSLTLAVNEAFSVTNAIKKLCSLPCDVEGCALFFNFTLLPPGGVVDKSETDNYNNLLETIGWFFFDLLLLGYVEDRTTGDSFHLPGGMKWSLFAEVPIRDSTMTPEQALDKFIDEVPALGLLGDRHLIDKTMPIEICPKAQLVCKYLKAYDDIDQFRFRRIDTLYPLGNNVLPHHDPPPPVKFSLDPDLGEEECQKLFNKYTDDNIKRNKLMQQLFIRYMYRRCDFLDTLPAFNYNNGVGDTPKAITTELGSTLMGAMLKEVKEFCDPTVKQNWMQKPHQQLIYDNASIGLLTLQPDQLPNEDKEKFRKIGIRLPKLRDIQSRKYLDEWLSRALHVPLTLNRLKRVDDSAYVLTVDYAVKMLNINERYRCGIPIILEGETGVGKTALLEMLRDLWDESLLSEWRLVQGGIFYYMEKHIGDLPEEAVPNYAKCAETVVNIKAGQSVNVEDLVLLGQTPDCATPNPAQYFYSLLRQKLLLLKDNSIISLLPLVEDGQNIFELLQKVEHEDTAESVASLLKAVFTVKAKCFFHKLNVHSGLKPADIQEFFAPILREAEQIIQHTCTYSKEFHHPSVMVFLDEVNTSSCLGLFKEVITDRTLDGEPIPDNVFIVAACNPHRGDSLAIHAKSKETWLSPSYYVRQLHPTLEFLKWDYGSLGEYQEREYIAAKMKMLQGNSIRGNSDMNEDILGDHMSEADIASLTELIVGSHNQVREYATEQLQKCNISDAKKYSKCCVSQRDIQRVFMLFSKLKSIYEHFKPHGQEQDYNRRAIVVALGIVYYMRLSAPYREKYVRFLDNQHLLGRQVSFSHAFEDDMNWFINQTSLPRGIAKTQALKENLFATIMCTMTRIPLIITGEPGSSKTLSFNLTVANLKGQESRNEMFRCTKLFPSLEPHFYQCSRRTTASEIEKVFLHSVKRQKIRTAAGLPEYCTVFMDEAGLPTEKHEALKVLHSQLDQPEVSFVAITNHILDAAKTNRAVSLFRPSKSMEDLEILAKGCICKTPESPHPELKDDIDKVVNFCQAYREVMEDPKAAYFFGLRDFIHLISFFRRKLEQGGTLTEQLVLQSLERNFNGMDEIHVVWDHFLAMMNTKSEDMKQRSVLKILKESLQDRPQVMSADNEVRYKLIIDPSEDDSLVRLLFHCGVLDGKNTFLYMCSDFPSDGQLQKISTISGIRHSAVQGHTVVLSQTDDIHESFYDLFNQRFQRIEYDDGTRYFTNIAIGPIIKPSRVDKDFQCLVVIKKSEVDSTPAPFLNRFEKYYITHEALLKANMEYLSQPMRMLLQFAVQQGEEFIHCLEGPSSFYGLQPETLNSLVLMMLPFGQKYTHEGKEKKVFRRGNKQLYFLKALLQALCSDAKFCIPQFSDAELAADAAHIFSFIRNDREMAVCFEGLNYNQIDAVIDEMLRKLHDNDCGDVITVSIQLMTPEAMIHHRMKIPTSYLEDYIDHQNHCNLRGLISKFCQMLEHDEHYGSTTPTKLLCFTRSSPLIHKLSATHPLPAQKYLSDVNKRFLKEMLYSNPDKLMVCKLSSLRSQSSIQDLLKEFIHNQEPCNGGPKEVFVITVNMQETSKKMINHLRFMIEEAESQANTLRGKKLFVVLLHFPPSMFLDASYPSLFLQGWNHFYLDTIGYSSTDAVLNVSDWLQLSCFGPNSIPHAREALIPALMEILLSPEVVGIISSQIPFLTQPSGSLSEPTMSLRDRMQGLRHLFHKRKVAEVICERFQFYWNPTEMMKYLERAATITYQGEYTLNITSSLETEFKSRFFDFLVYIVTKINEDILKGCPDHEEITDLFMDILKVAPLPELSQLRASLKNINHSTMNMHGTSFPFFSLVSSQMDKIVEESKAEVNQQLNLLSEDDLQFGREVPCSKVHDVVHTRIRKLFESEQEECLSPAIKAMSSNTVWERYFCDYIHQRLHIPIDYKPSEWHMATEVLKVCFTPILNQQSPMDRFVHLHIAVNIYELKYVKLSTVIRALNKISQNAIEAEASPSPECTLNFAQSFLVSVRETQLVIGSPHELSKFVINTLFNVMFAGVPKELGNGRCGKQKLQQWYKAYHEVVSMPVFKSNITVQQTPTIKTKFALMHTLYLILRSRSVRDDSHLEQACDFMKPLVQSYFTEELQLQEVIHLKDIFVRVIDYLERLEPQQKSKQGGYILEGLLSHFIPAHNVHSLDSEDLEWLLKYANAQHHWGKSMQYLDLKDAQTLEPTLHTGYISLHMFKKYLIRVLQPGDMKVMSDSGPLGLYQAGVREQVGKVLVNTIGTPGPYVPPFYQHLSYCRREGIMVIQQPLAHLYFLCVFESFLIKEHSADHDMLSYLILALEGTTQYIEDRNTTDSHRALLYIEKQAILQVLLKSVAKHLDPENSNALDKLFSANRVEALNNIFRDDSTLGGMGHEAHGYVLTLHLLRQFQSFHKLHCLLVEKYDVICAPIACLQPVHTRLQVVNMGKLHCLHLFLLGDDQQLHNLYTQVNAEMLNVKHSGGRVFNTFVQTAKKYCSDDTTNGSVRSQYKMILWMCTYFGFFDKKVSSRTLADVVAEQLKDFLEPEYICLIRFFLLAYEKDSEAKSGQNNNPVLQIFYPECPHDKGLCDAIAVMVAVILGSPARASPFWYHMFAADEIAQDYIENLRCEKPVDGVILLESYWKRALKGSLSFQSHILMIWANLSSLCMALLTQPAVECKTAAIAPEGILLFSEFCALQLHQLWSNLYQMLHITEEQCVFLTISCMKRLYQACKQTNVMNFPMGRFVQQQQLQDYETFWHDSIFIPSWTTLKEEFSCYTELSITEVFADLRKLDASYPILPNKLGVTEAVLASQGALNPLKNSLYFLAKFCLNLERMELGGVLLPELIELYQWLHSELAFQLTRDQVATLSIKQVLDVVTRHLPKDAKETLLSLYNKVRDHYNAYITLCGRDACHGGVVLKPIDDQQTKIQELLSLSSDPTQESVGMLYHLISLLIETHNNFLEWFTCTTVDEKYCYLPEAIHVPSLRPNEVDETTAIVSKQGASCFLELILSCSQTPDVYTNSVGNEQIVVSRSSLDPHLNPLIDVHKLQTKTIEDYLLGKPSIQCFTPQKFRFRDIDTPSHPIKASINVPTLDLTAIALKLPMEFKREMSRDFSKHFEIDFHSAPQSVLLKVAIGLRTLAGHLIMVLLDKVSKKHHETLMCTQTVQQFIEQLYGSRTSIEIIGIQSEELSRNQLSCVRTLKLEYLYATLKFFADWINDDFCDYCDLPYAMKVELPDGARQVLQEIPTHFTDMQALAVELKSLCAVLRYSAVPLTRKVCDGGLGHDATEKPLLDVIKIPPECQRLTSLIPREIHIKHYVKLLLLLRILHQKLQVRSKPEPSTNENCVKRWTECVLDQLGQKLCRRKTATLGQRMSSHENYGFAGDKIKSTLQTDLADLMQHSNIDPVNDPNGVVEECDHYQQSSRDAKTITEDGMEARARSINVATFLKDIGMGEYIETFEEEEVNGADLLRMPDKVLKENLGVKSPLHRLKIKMLFTRILQGTEPKHTVTDVVTFLQSTRRFSKYASCFERNGIDGELLLCATADVLEEVGVENDLHKTQIQTRFQEYIDTHS